MVRDPGTVYRFEEFELAPAELRLTRNGQEVALQPKVFEALFLLVQRSGRLVTKQELMDALWPDTNVNEEALTQAIRKLRRAIGDHPDEPHFVQTVLKGGYRFLPPVAVIQHDQPESRGETPAPDGVTTAPPPDAVLTGPSTDAML
jgi:DNA-binding winged helix-turn-helix (wHTH) protein